MFMNFITNNVNELSNDLVLHIYFRDNKLPFNYIQCLRLQLASNVRYLGLIFDTNLRRNLHFNSLVM